MRRVRTHFRVEPRTVLALVVLGSGLLRVFWLDRPMRSLIFDETYYVNAARRILGIAVPAGSPYQHAPAGLDPNTEHPPLGKALLSASIHVFGDNAWGWRIPSVIAGLVAIVALYALVRRASDDAWLAVIAAAVFAADNLVFAHSRIATLDMPALSLLLVGAWSWTRGWWIGAGAICAFAALIKETAIAGALALFVLTFGSVAATAVRRRVLERRALSELGLFVGSFVAVFLLGLWLLDLALTRYGAPWEHVGHIVRYGVSLTRPGGPANEESQPWQWLANDVKMTYLHVSEDIIVDGSVVARRPLVDFRGAMNPAVIGVAPLAVAYSLWRAWRVRELLAQWVVAWFATTYIALYPLAVFGHRTMYIYYFLFALPAVAVAIAQLLRHAVAPRSIGWGYACALGAGIVAYFPFRRIF